MIKASKQLEKKSNFDLIIIIIFIFSILLILISYEDPIEKDLKDGKCNVCGGTWYYSHTVSLWSRTHYWYKCDVCGKEVKTCKWHGKGVIND